MECSFAVPVEYIETLSQAAKDVAWADTVQRDGFFEVRVRAEYIGLIDALKRSIRVREAPDSPQSLSIPSLKLTGVAAESENRTNYFFLHHDRQVLLTRWRFVADGARLCFPADKINYVEGGMRGTIALSRSVASASRKALWKMRWLTADEQVQFELYVEDQMNLGGHFDLTHLEIKALSKVATEAVMAR